ncbi:MAG TPA: methylated-DNA--[protein]-cysteine S-methyltransferase [Solirubrobacteraceae bacterium]|nr:methylated-DNA--[protein]-cysteine S-methyltransferase [Solirubrobacteraceae bacterium]
MSHPPDLDAAFTAAGLLDVAYAVEPSPVGDLLLAASPEGLLEVAYPDADGHERTLETLAREISPRVLAAPGRLDPVRRQLEEYFAGRRRGFAITLDRRRIRTGFPDRVLVAAATIPYGATASYGRVAAAAGSPRAHRAAGRALGANPLPVIIPCHRVLPASGRLGGYSGGPERKAILLELERLVSGA